MIEPILVPRGVVPHLRIGLLKAVSQAAELLSTLTVTGTVTRPEAYRSVVFVLDSARALLDKVGLVPPPEEERELVLEGDEFPMLVLRVLKARYGRLVRTKADGEAGRFGLRPAKARPPDAELRTFIVALDEQVRPIERARQEAAIIDAALSRPAPSPPFPRRRRP
jgi:hypothetical protein